MTELDRGGFDLAAMAAALGGLDAREVDGTTKGIPCHTGRQTLGEVASRKWNLLKGDMAAPVAFVRKAALDGNALWMKRLLSHFDLQLAPHAKTTMTPHIFAHQAMHGSWGLTVATVQQADVAASFGCRRIILANQVIGTTQVDGLLDILSRFQELTVYVFADSIQGVRQFRDAPPVARDGRLRLLVDVGFAGGRTGCRTMAEAESVVREILVSGIRPGGVGGYEGLITNPGGSEDAAAVERYFNFFADAAQMADGLGCFADGHSVLTAGGSAYYDIVGRRLGQIKTVAPAAKVLRSGCYATHDCGTYVEHMDHMRSRDAGLVRQLGELEPALFVAGVVQSRPEADLALLTMGKRDVGFDAHLPVPVWHHRPTSEGPPRETPPTWSIFRLNDQHAYMRIEADCEVAIGDLIICGISHPCTTFDRWRLIHLLDDEWTSIGVMPTFF